MALRYLHSGNNMGRACVYCYRKIVELLLTNEASSNIVDVKGSSPLHLAAWSGNVDIVRMLLCHGPSIPNVNLMVRKVFLYIILYIRLRYQSAVFLLCRELFK